MEQNAEQEMMMKFQMYEQQINMIQRQLQAVEQAIVEMGSLSVGLDDLVGKKDSEILAPMGRGIYLKTKLISEDLTVEIGDKNYVKKSIPETKKLISDQVKKLEEARDNLNSELEKINNEITDAFMKSQGHTHENSQEHHHEHSHKHNHYKECDCGNSCACGNDECGCGHRH